jgi:hypothetical protein
MNKAPKSKKAKLREVLAITDDPRYFLFINYTSQSKGLKINKSNFMVQFKNPNKVETDYGASNFD